MKSNRGFRFFSVFLVISWFMASAQPALFAGEVQNDLMWAGNIAHAETPGNGTETILIAAFDALPEETLFQNFMLGEIEGKDALILPEELTGADIEDNAIVIKDVLWTSVPAFDPELIGIYAFTPMLPERYATAEGLVLPVISVAIQPQVEITEEAEALYNAGDVAIINSIITNNGLDWTIADPADGSMVPDDWRGVYWYSTAQGNRIYSLSIPNKGLSGSLDVSGLTELEKLSCHTNNLTALNASGLTALKSLYCYNNNLTELNVSGLTSLEILSCYQNNLTALDVSGLTSLEILSCTNNNLTALDVSDLTRLFELYCHSNSLTSLDLSGLNRLYMLYCHSNSLTSLNVSGLTTLNVLYCYENDLTTLDFSDMPNLYYISCSRNNLTTLNLSNLPELQVLYCYDNNLTTLNISNTPMFCFLSCGDNNLSTLSLSNVPLDTLYCYNNNLSVLDLSSNLTTLRCENNPISYLKFYDYGDKYTMNVNIFPSGSGTVLLTEYDHRNKRVTLSATADTGYIFNGWTDDHLPFVPTNTINPIKYDLNKYDTLTVSAHFVDAGAKRYNAGDVAVINNIIENNGLDWPKAPADGSAIPREWTGITWSSGTYDKRVVDLSLCGKGLSGTLDVIQLHALKKLYCYNNELTSLKVSGLTVLEYLYCYNNKLTALDVSGLPALRYLECNSNKLSTLIVSDCPVLKELKCSDNPISYFVLDSDGYYHSLKVAVSPPGSGTVMLSGFNYYNKTVTLRATPEPGYALKEWTYDKVYGATGGTFTLPGSTDPNWGSGTAVANFVSDDTSRFNPGDIAVINAIIENNGLKWTKAPMDGSSVPSNWSNVVWSSRYLDMRVVELSLGNKGLSGTLDVSDLSELKSLNTYNNNLSALKVSGLTKLKTIYCNNNNLGSLDISDCPALSSLSFNNNPISYLKLKDVNDNTYIMNVGVAPTGCGTVMLTDYTHSSKSVTLNFTANTGYKFDGWTYGGLNSAPGAMINPVSFTIPSNGIVTATANAVSMPTFAVAITSVGAGVTGSGSYTEGATVNIDAGTAPEGHQFKEWTSVPAVVFANPNSANTSFTMPAGSVTVTAVFEPILIDAHRVTVSSAGMNATGSGNYEAGMTVNIYAGVAPAGKRFMQWVADPNVDFVNERNANTSFTMPADAVKVTAIFEPLPPYTVTVNSEGKGATGSGNYAAGETVDIYAGAAPAGHRFKEWTAVPNVIFANRNEANTIFTMPTRSVTVLAVFEPIPPVTYAVTINGGGTGATGSGYYEAGATVNINAGAAPAGQRFKEWTAVPDVIVNRGIANTSFTMPAGAVRVTAVFEPIPAVTYAVTVTGAGTGATGGGSYKAGATVNISAGAAPAGHRFKEWSAIPDVIVNRSSANTSFTMPAGAVKITAVFEPIPPATYRVTLSGGGTGATGGGNYAAGATVNIRAGTAPSGRRFKEWTAVPDIIFGNRNSANTSFTMPACAVTINAVFESIPPVNSPVNVPVTSVSLDKTELSLQVGGGTSLKATVSPNNATNKSVTWTSSNPSIVTVDANGNVSAKARGTAVITVKTAGGGFSATCTVKVTLPIISSAQFNKIASRGTKGTAIEVLPNAGTVIKTISSNKTSVVAVNGNLLELVGAGKATIKITYMPANAKKAKTITKTITVTSKVTGVTLDKTEATIARKGKITLKASILPADATNKAVTWSSSNKKVATVSNKGVVTGVGRGTCTITVKTKDGAHIAKATITVTPIYETGIKLNKTKVSLNKGKSVQLKATLSPSTTDFKTVTWISSNSDVAKVDAKGKVTAVQAGTCTILASSANGKVAKCVITTKP